MVTEKKNKDKCSLDWLKYFQEPFVFCSCYHFRHCGCSDKRFSNKRISNESHMFTFKEKSIYISKYNQNNIYIVIYINTENTMTPGLNLPFGTPCTYIRYLMYNKICRLLCSYLYIFTLKWFRLVVCGPRCQPISHWDDETINKLFTKRCTVIGKLLDGNILGR